MRGGDVYKTICGHDWEKVDAHKRRYRCKWCGALGYTRAPMPGSRKNQERIMVYACSVAGCNEPAVAVQRSGGTMVYQRCAKHDTRNKG
jgi:hypothetical protein